MWREKALPEEPPETSFNPQSHWKCRVTGSRWRVPVAVSHPGRPVDLAQVPHGSPSDAGVPSVPVLGGQSGRAEACGSS